MLIAKNLTNLPFKSIFQYLVIFSFNATYILPAFHKFFCVYSS